MHKPIPLFKRLLVELQSNCNRDCFFCNRRGDDSGKRIGSDGRKVIRSMPTRSALGILDQAASMGFRGLVSFHHMSEPFLDPRIIDMAWEARKRGMLPYEHTNGDVLKSNESLCRAAAEVFEHIVVGVYDCRNESEYEEEKALWRRRLHGTRVGFSVVHGHVFPRTLTPFDSRMTGEKIAYPRGVCRRPLRRLIVHYDGHVAFCCEDMRDEFGLGNALETPIEDIWYSERHIRTIKDLEKGLRRKYPLCRACPIPPPPVVDLPTRAIRKVARIGKRLASYARRESGMASARRGGSSVVEA